MVSSKTIAALGLLTFLSPVSSTRLACGMDRDMEDCKAKTTLAEVKCLLRQNSLTQVMGCITKDNKQKNSEVCRRPDDGRDNDVEDYYIETGSTKGLICIEPRDVLLSGPLNTTKGASYGIVGQIKACPEYDPDFKQCLCETAVTEVHFKFMWSAFGMRSNKENLKCTGNFAAKRSSFLDHEAANVPHLHMAHEKRHGASRHQIRAAGASREFFIDQWGRPNYDDETIGYRLPYFDSYITNNLARRCYIHPTEPEIASCRTWRKAMPATTSVGFAPKKAVYTKVWTPTATITPTATAEPETTSLAQEMLEESQASSVPSTPTPTVGSSGAAGGMVSSVPVGRTVWAAFITVAGMFFIL